MKRSLLVLFASFVSISTVATATVSPLLKNLPMSPRPVLENDWNADFEAAAKLAKEQKKDLLVDFTGSGWCGWCTKLKNEVFDKKEFLESAREKYVLVLLDFEQTGKPKPTQLAPKAAEDLKARLKVDRFPTIVLLTADGELFAKTSYRPGGPEQYVAHLAEIGEAGHKRLDELHAFDREVRAARGEDRARKVGEALEKLNSEPADSLFLNQVARTVKVAFEGSDVPRETQVAAAKALIEKSMVDDDVGAAVLALDPKNEQSLREQYALAVCNSVTGEGELARALKVIGDVDAAGKINDKSVAEQLYANAAWWNFNFLQNVPEKKEAALAEAKRYAQKVKDLGPSNPRLAAIVDQILQS